MRKMLLIFTIAVSLLVLTGCEADTTPSGSEKKETIFNEVKKACDGNDMIYLIDGYREAGLAVVANHPDCVSVIDSKDTHDA